MVMDPHMQVCKCAIVFHLLNQRCIHKHALRDLKKPKLIKIWIKILTTTSIFSCQCTCARFFFPANCVTCCFFFPTKLVNSFLKLFWYLTNYRFRAWVKTPEIIDLVPPSGHYKVKNKQNKQKPKKKEKEIKWTKKNKINKMTNCNRRKRLTKRLFCAEIDQGLYTVYRSLNRPKNLNIFSNV